VQTYLQYSSMSFPSVQNFSTFYSSLLWQPLDQCPIAALTSKSQRQISSGEHELCNSQENLIKNYNSILPTIYIKSSWSILWLYLYCASYPKVYVSSISAPCIHYEVAMLYPHIHYSSTSKSACHIHVLWHHLLDSSWSF